MSLVELKKTTPSAQLTTTRTITGEGHLSLHGISHHYGKNQRLILNDITLAFRRGEIAVVLGVSGSGKSTLLQIISGLLVPAAGTVLVAGNEYRKPTSQSVLLYQEPLLFPWLTVSQNIGLALRYARVSPEQAKLKVYELLSLTGLTPVADSKPQNISGGQQQRAALARALAANPEILLLDEPFSNLDPFIRQYLQTEVTAISRLLGLTVVMVTHDLDEAIRMADRILILSNHTGRIEGDFTLDDTASREPDAPSFNRFKRKLIRHFEAINGEPAVRATHDTNLELQQ